MHEAIRASVSNLISSEVYDNAKSEVLLLEDCVDDDPRLPFSLQVILCICTTFHDNSLPLQVLLGLPN